MIITEIQSIWLLTKSQSTQIHGDLMIIYLDRNWYFWFTDTSDLNIRIRLLSGLMHVLFHLDIFTQTYSVPLCYKGDGIILCNGIHSFPKLVHQETLDGTLRAPPLACDSQVVTAFPLWFTKPTGLPMFTNIFCPKIQATHVYNGPRQPNHLLCLTHFRIMSEEWHNTFWLHAEDYWSPCTNIVYGGPNRVKVENLAHGQRYCFTVVAANKIGVFNPW